MYRRTTAADNDALIDTMNENNWQEFLKVYMEAALDIKAAYNRDGTFDKEHWWLANIFEHFGQCFVTYKVMFKEVAYYFTKLLFLLDRIRITKVCNFALI